MALWRPNAATHDNPVRAGPGRNAPACDAKSPVVDEVPQ